MRCTSRFVQRTLCVFSVVATTGAGAQTFGTGQSPWMQVSNQMSISVEHYTVNGIDGRQQPFTYIFHGTPTLQIGDTPVPFSFVLSSFENSYQAPFNQMGSSPKYKWIQLHVGYRNLNFSNFTLGGQRMLGAGVELTPGKWQFGFFWGVLRKAIAPDSTETEPAPPGNFYFGPGYRRSGWGAKIGYGKKDKSNITLSMFRGQDHENSLDEEFHALVRKPEANTVLGLAWRVAFSEKFAWYTDAGFSAYTRNAFSDSTDMEDIPSAQSIQNVFLPRASSQYLTALETGFQYQSKKFRATLKYRRIDPDFKSMGIYFINSDLQEITFNPSMRFGQKLAVNGSIGTQRDNLKDLKGRTTERLIYRIAADWSPSQKFALGVQHSNFGITQSALAPNIADTTLMRQVSTMYAVQPRLTLMRDKIVHLISLNASHQQLSNLFSGAFAAPDVQTNQVTAVYAYTVVQRQLSISPSLTLVDVSSDAFSTQSVGGSVGVSSPLHFIPVQGSVQGAYFTNRVDGASSGSTISTSLQLTYRLKNGMSFNAGAQYLSNQGSTSQALPSFTEVRLRAGFAWAISKSFERKKAP